MKPVKLCIAAFGSYPGTEVIDFEALSARGLFVVSGDTGTGKTTIFDAMCWALFGTMPGKDAKEVRSHHVADEVRTEVQFTFECGGERYVVTRNPEQLRPAKTGSRLVKEPTSATLVRVTDGRTEAIATKTADVAKQCTELIGLGAEQFQRVVLLPQGEFSRFLLASTTEREPLLSQLFGGEVFDRVTEELKHDRDELAEQVGDTDRQLTEQLNAARTNVERAATELGIDVPEGLAQADRAAIEALRAGLDEPLATLRSRVCDLDEEATRLARSLDEQKGAAKRFDEAEHVRGQLRELAQKAAEITAGSDAAARSAAARPVVNADEALADATTRAAASLQALEDTRTRIEKAFEPFDVTVDTASYPAVAKALNDQREQVRDGRRALEMRAAARTAVEKASAAEQQRADDKATTEAALQGSTDRLGEIEQRLADLRAGAIDPAEVDRQIERAVELVTKRTQLDEALRRHGDASVAADEASTRYRTVFETFIRTQAPRLAATLDAGEPCPVCGSTEHPAPAVADDGEAVGFDHVEKASSEQEAANAALNATKATVAELRGALGDEADTPLDTLQARHAALRDQAAGARATAAEIDGLGNEHTKLAEHSKDAATTLARLTAQLESARHEVAQCTAQLEEATAAAAGLDPDEIHRRDALLGSLDEDCAELNELLGRVSTEKGGVEEAERSRTTALAASPFDSVEAARTVLLSEDDEAARRDAKEQFEADRLRAETKLRALEEEGIPDQRPDVEAIGHRAERAKAAHTEQARALTTVTNAVDYLDDARRTHDALLEASGDVRSRLEVVERTYLVCRNGSQGVEMSLKRWVLTRELDRVTAAANVHLHRMTGQRYTLRRHDERTDGRKVFGLDLVVLDAQTGRARSTSSLSGGEQFQASLALALGLADVVSHGGASSGKRFEALFVDEGFGSLSAEALDDAIETLYQLHATGRMVGAITHVDAMKQQLHVGIEVRRRPDGAGSTLVVHP
ncbi:MAG: SMC family ATPase [Acidimicrobiia bacterium]|nr:SMC family ATPase [Acidimicrobiia bacterium]